jgi:hypothetical protein
MDRDFKNQGRTMMITLEGVTIPQAIALTKMFEFMQALGNVGSSRWVGFFSDGDGNFRPKVKVNYPVPLPESKAVVKEIKETFFGIDFDEIAWELDL